MTRRIHLTIKAFRLAIIPVILVSLMKDSDVLM